MLYHIYLFVYLKPSLHTRDKINLAWLNDLSDVLLDSINMYFVEDFFASIFTGNIGLQLPFIVMHFSDFGIRVILDS